MTEDPRKRETDPASEAPPDTQRGGSKPASELSTTEIENALEAPRVPRVPRDLVEDAPDELTAELAHLKGDLPPEQFLVLRWVDKCRAQLAGKRLSDDANWRGIQQSTSATNIAVEDIKRQLVEMQTAHSADFASLRPPAHLYKSARILLVEDDVRVLSSFARLFRDRGHTVIEAADAVEAEAALLNAPQGAVIDVCLGPRGNTDGFDLACRMREEYPTVGTILFTGGSLTDLQREIAKKLGIEVFFKPPKDSDAVLDALMDAIKRVGSGGAKAM